MANANRSSTAATTASKPRLFIAYPTRSDERQASDSLLTCQWALYALNDIGRRFATSAFSAHTMDCIIHSTTAAARASVDEARASLRKGHQAHAHLERAYGSLYGFDELISAFRHDDDYAASPCVIGESLVAQSVKAMRALERALIACNASGFCAGYLEDPDLDPAAPPRVPERATEVRHG